MILTDGTIVNDEYSTPARWSRVMLAHIIRIAWCCLFSYFISELRRDELWACPQLSSYYWWGCEYNMYHCWQNCTFNFLGEVDICELYYWPASVFSRAFWRCSSLNLSVSSLTWLTYAFWDALSRWRWFWRVLTPPTCMPNILDWARQLMYVYDQLRIIISSSSMVAMLGMGAGPSKLR